MTRFRAPPTAGANAELRGRDPHAELLEGHVVLDLCGGIATTALALVQANKPVRGFVVVENDCEALILAARMLAWALKHYPSFINYMSVEAAFRYPDLTLFGPAALDAIERLYLSPTTLVVAGTPC